LSACVGAARSALRSNRALVMPQLTPLQMKWLAPHVGHTLPFPDAKQALALLQSGKTTGKVLLEVNRQ
jgi:NADPH:quinone reductase-like Zn-dependent oxidoreductase